jgi:hypothetical protein
MPNIETIYHIEQFRELPQTRLLITDWPSSIGDRLNPLSCRENLRLHVEINLRPSLLKNTIEMISSNGKIIIASSSHRFGSTLRTFLRTSIASSPYK